MSRTLSSSRLLLRTPVASCSTSSCLSLRSLSLSRSRAEESLSEGWQPSSEPSSSSTFEPLAPTFASRQIFKKGQGRKDDVYWAKKALPRKTSKDHISLRNLPHGLDKDGLAQILRDNGVAVGSVRIMVWPREDGRFISRGYGWASLTNPEDEKKGIQRALKLDGLEIMGNRLTVGIMEQRINGSLYGSSRVFPPKPTPIPHIPVPGQWAYDRDQALIAAGLPTPNYHAGIDSPSQRLMLTAPVNSHPHVIAREEKKLKMYGAAGLRHKQRFVPGMPRAGEGPGEGGFGLKNPLEEIPVMVGVGGQQKWTAKRRSRAEVDGWGIKPVFEREEGE